MLKYLYVYILACSDKTYYTGVTNDYERRFIEHHTGINHGCYTYFRRPLKLVYCEQFDDYKTAIEWEKKIKNWSKKKKEALINKKWDSLKNYAVCYNLTSHKNHIK